MMLYNVLLKSLLIARTPGSISASGGIRGGRQASPSWFMLSSVYIAPPTFEGLILYYILSVLYCCCNCCRRGLCCSTKPRSLYEYSSPMTHINPSATSRVLTDHFTDHFFLSFFCLARSSRVGDFLKYPNSTCKELYCTTEQRCACKKGQTKDTLRVRHEGMKRTSRLCVVCCVDLGDIAYSACRSIAGSAAYFSCLL